MDASPTTNVNDILLLADRGTINTGVNAATPIGVYAKVNAGTITFDITNSTTTTDLVPAINVNIAASTNYTVVLEGEPGLPDYQAFAFADTNALNSSSTVRVKINNAAPNLSTPVDVYLWLNGNAIPGQPIVGGLALNQDTGTTPSHPGNAYIPTQGSANVLAGGTYNIAVVPAGTAPNGSTDLFDGSTTLNTNVSYSLTLEDVNATPNTIDILQSIDEPFQSSNQSVIARKPIHHRV